MFIKYLALFVTAVLRLIISYNSLWGLLHFFCLWAILLPVLQLLCLGKFFAFSRSPNLCYNFSQYLKLDDFFWYICTYVIPVLNITWLICCRTQVQNQYGIHKQKELLAGNFLSLNVDVFCAFGIPYVM